MIGVGIGLAVFFLKGKRKTPPSEYADPAVGHGTPRNDGNMHNDKANPAEPQGPINAEPIGDELPAAEVASGRVNYAL